jgi:hypothetical protein
MFVMNNVHEDAPLVFETRWAMSYLRGPMTRVEIKQLCDARKSASSAANMHVAPPPTVGSTTPVSPLVLATPRSPAAPMNAASASMNAAIAPMNAASASMDADAAPATQRPVIAADVAQFFVPLAACAGPIEYRPALFGSATVAFREPKLGIEACVDVVLLVECSRGPVAVDWAASERLDIGADALDHEPAPNARFAALPADCAKAKSYDAWRKAFVDHVYRSAQLEVSESARTGLCSQPGESERAFRARLAQLARESRDAAVDKLRAKYAPKLALLDERRRKREQMLDVQKQQASGAKLGTALSFGSALLSAFLGRSRASGNVGRAATAARGVGRSMKEANDVERAQADIAAVDEQLRALREQLESDSAAVTAENDATTDTLTPRKLSAKRSAVSVRTVVLAWAPYRADGTPAWK